MEQIKKFNEYIKESAADEQTLIEDVYIILSGDEKWYFKEKSGSTSGIDIRYGIDNPKEIFPVNNHDGVNTYEFHPVSELSVDKLATAYYNNKHGSMSLNSWLFLELDKAPRYKADEYHTLKDMKPLIQEMKESNAIFIGFDKRGIGSYTVPVHTGEHIDFDKLKPKIVKYSFGAFKNDADLFNL